MLSKNGQNGKSKEKAINFIKEWLEFFTYMLNDKQVLSILCEVLKKLCLDDDYMYYMISHDFMLRLNLLGKGDLDLYFMTLYCKIIFKKGFEVCTCMSVFSVSC